jgi:hypothetical protein
MIDPEVTREVCLVTVVGRRWSSPVATFVQAIRRYSWPTITDLMRRAAAEREQDSAAG